MVVLEASLDFGADFEGTEGMGKDGVDDSACSFSQVSPSALAKWSSTVEIKEVVDFGLSHNGTKE